MLLAEGSRFRRPTMLPGCRGERDRVEQLDAGRQEREVQVPRLAAHSLHLHACECISKAAAGGNGRRRGLAGARARPLSKPCPDPSAGSHPPLLALPQKDQKTHNLILDSVTKLKQRGVKSDWIPVRCAAH